MKPTAAPPALRRPPGAEPRDREAALRNVRRARRHLEPVRPLREQRRERFAYLKRVYD